MIKNSFILSSLMAIAFFLLAGFLFHEAYLFHNEKLDQSIIYLIYQTLTK